MTQAVTSSESLGVGLYPIVDAARIIGAKPNTIRRWLKKEEGLLPREVCAGDTIIFVELMELHFIKMFRDEGVSLQVIKAASKKAADRYGSQYPFSFKRFDTDGKAIFGTMQSDPGNTEMVQDIARSQYVFEKIMRPFFRKLEYGNNELVRFWPLSKSGRVVLDPKRKFGQPIDSETGIPTHVIANALKAGGGQSPAVVARWLGIPLAAVKKAAQFERLIAAA